MISQQLLDELRIIIWEDYQVELNSKEIREVAEALLRYGELAIKVGLKDKNNKSKGYASS